MADPVPSADDITRVRRLTSEPTSTTFTDDMIIDSLERYPLIDTTGLHPGEVGWLGAWDQHAASADIWEEKAAAYVGSFDFSADGASFSRSQVYSQMQEQAKKCRSRASAKSVPMKIFPIVEVDPIYDRSYVGNLSEAAEGR